MMADIGKVSTKLLRESVDHYQSLIESGVPPGDQIDWWTRQRDILKREITRRERHGIYQ